MAEAREVVLVVFLSAWPVLQGAWVPISSSLTMVPWQDYVRTGVPSRTRGYVEKGIELQRETWVLRRRRFDFLGGRIGSRRRGQGRVDFSI